MLDHAPRWYPWDRCHQHTPPKTGICPSAFNNMLGNIFLKNGESIENLWSSARTAYPFIVRGQSIKQTLPTNARTITTMSRSICESMFTVWVAKMHISKMPSTTGIFIEVYPMRLKQWEKLMINHWLFSSLYMFPQRWEPATAIFSSALPLNKPWFYSWVEKIPHLSPLL